LKNEFHLGGLKTNELMEGLKERVPTEEEDPREAPHEPLRSSEPESNSRSRMPPAIGCGRERGFGEEGNG
jgi:hypothetical protein